MLKIFKSEEEKINDRIQNLLKRYVEPHTLISREVTKKDIKQVLNEAQELFDLCFVPHGIYKRALALAHPQIENKDPLRFFVTQKQWLIINPEIVRQTEFKNLKPEGCLTFSFIQPKMHLRSHKLELKYQTIDEEGNLTKPMVSKFKGEEAQMIQHEMDHLNGVYIYDSRAYYEMLRIQNQHLPKSGIDQIS